MKLVEASNEEEDIIELLIHSAAASATGSSKIMLSYVGTSSLISSSLYSACIAESVSGHGWLTIASNKVSTQHVNHISSETLLLLFAVLVIFEGHGISFCF
jgi:hypothetical protein